MSKLNYAGQFDLVAAEILQANGGLNIDIREQIHHITIYEDLFSPYMSGNLYMSDTFSLPEILGNAGGDILHLIIKTPTIDKENEINRFFHIYKLAEQTKINERAQSFIYHFVSAESFSDSAISISKTFKSKGEDNINSILTGKLGSKAKFNSHSTKRDIWYTSNWWSPMRNFAYNADLSVCSETGTADMVFFENRDGFNFKSLTKMINEKEYQSFSTNDSLSKVTTDGMTTGQTNKDLSLDYGTINIITVPVMYDYLKDSTDGLLNTRMFSYDLTSKKITDDTVDTLKNGGKLANPNRFYKDKLIESSYQTHGSVRIMHSRHNKLHNGKTEVTDFKHKQKRISLMRALQQHKVEITVFGRTDYTVGQSVKLDINTMRLFDESSTNKEITDHTLSGKYLISALTHRFLRGGAHECTLELIRDSIMEKD